MNICLWGARLWKAVACVDMWKSGRQTQISLKKPIYLYIYIYIYIYIVIYIYIYIYMYNKIKYTPNKIACGNQAGGQPAKRAGSRPATTIIITMLLLLLLLVVVVVVVVVLSLCVLCVLCVLYVLLRIIVCYCVFLCYVALQRLLLAYY